SVFPNVGSSTVSRIRVLVAETDAYGRAVSAAIEKDRRLELVACVGPPAEAVARAGEPAPASLLRAEATPRGASARALGGRAAGTDLTHGGRWHAERGERLVVSPLTVRARARSIRNKLERKSALHH